MMRFYDFIDHLMHCQGIEEKDFQRSLSENGLMTDEMIFAVSRYINDIKGISIFFTKKIGDIEIRPRFFDIAVDWNMYGKDKTLRASLCLDLMRCILVLEFPMLDMKLTIRNNLFDYEEDYPKDKAMEIRTKCINDILVYYYSKILYSIYKELRRKREI